jgi:cytochrome b pre-mRNA-processing protein 3
VSREPGQLSITALSRTTKVWALLGLCRLRRGNRHSEAALALYVRAVAAAREPWLYQALGVPDTLDGRFDLLALYAFLLIHRLRTAPAPGPALAQAVFDAMFSDMDNTLRELGVSDLRVGKHMRAMWEALHGRAQAYASALDANDRGALAAAVARNVWRGAAPTAAARSLAGIVLAQTDHLAAQPLAAFVSGKVDFLVAAEIR